MNNVKRVMLKCGCAAQAVCSARGGIKYDPPIPSCVVHDCIEQIEAPNLEGRLARCHCGHTEPSSLGLAFFEFLGEGSRQSKEKCKCGAIDRLHLPHWEAKIKVVRRWFKIERSESFTTEHIHAADEEEAKAWADGHVRRWWKMGDGKMRNEKGQYEDGLTKVNEVELVSLKRTPAPRYHLKVCGTFTPMGAAKYDKFYCGCMGWD